MLKKFGWAATKIGLSIGLFSWFISRTDLNGIVGALANISLETVTILVVLNLIGVFVSAYKWLMLLPEASYKSLLASCLASYYYSIFLPGQLAQEAAKAYHFGKGGSTRMHMVAASVAVDKVSSVLGLLVVSLAGLAFSDESIFQSLFWLFIALGLGAIFSLFLLRFDSAYLLIEWICERLASAFPKRNEIFRGVLRGADAWHRYSKNLSMLGNNLLFSIGYQLIGVYMFYLLSQELHLQIDFFDWCWIVGALSMALFLPVTIGGIGVREGTLIGILGLFGCGSEMAMALSLIAFGFVIMLALMGGAVLLHGVKISEP